MSTKPKKKLSEFGTKERRQRMSDAYDKTHLEAAKALHETARQHSNAISPVVLNAWFGEALAEIERLNAEIERLRAALALAPSLELHTKKCLQLHRAIEQNNIIAAWHDYFDFHCRWCKRKLTARPTIAGGNVYIDDCNCSGFQQQRRKDEYAKRLKRTEQINRSR